jgi:GMP synthase-like glutamine amidotransferase
MIRGMSVLILKNVQHEGPGTIEDYLRNNGISYRIVDCTSEDIPDAPEFDTLVMMGGPMSVNQTESYPYLQKEINAAAAYMKSGKKVLGVCLGAQIMARALGAPVYAGAAAEIGWYDIELLDAGLRDRVMTQVALHPRAGDFWKRFKVFHWHGETFDIPEGAERLAGSALYPNQAFRYGKNSYAFQFHLEVTQDMIYDWLRNEAIDKDRLKGDTELFYEEYAGRALSFYKAFFQ